MKAVIYARVSTTDQTTENQTLEFTVGFAPTDDAPKFKWQLPSFAINVIKNNDYSVSYQLHLGAPQQSNDSLGIFRFSDNDLMAFDPLWLATPVFEDEQHYLPPRWQLNLRYAPYLVAVSAPMLKVELDDATGLKTSLTQAVPAGKCWPFFAVANYRSLSTNDFKWFLRLDSKSKLPEEMVTQLLELNQQLDKLLGPQISEFTIASFPYSNDRSFPGLLVFDEQRNWFDSPTDNFLDGFSRRTHLARYLCEYRFGVECRGLGTASLFLTRSLAEFLSYLLLTESGLEKDAEKLQQHWRLKEQQHPKLAQALSLLTINDLYGPRRLLSFGALVWNDIFDKLGRKQFLSLCR
ncbi:MAG: hypothetical protein QGF46_08610, partial [Planctomycetota bacterium]|nr:hypothetical protein [Planctomycetota bacterium]